MSDFKHGFRTLLGLIMLPVAIFVATGCNGQPTPIQPTFTLPTITLLTFTKKPATLSPVNTPRPLPLFSSPTGTQVTYHTPTPSLPLNNVGPWIFDDIGEMVYSMDGGSAELAHLDIAEAFNHYAIAPQGGWLAIKPGYNNPWSQEAEYEILIYHLPDNQPVQRFLLLGDPAREAIRKAVDHGALDPMGPAVVNSLVFEDNMLWSSNARYLAFAAALDGTSSDIYLFDTYSDSLQRLTSEEDQVVLMSWSPDDQTIIYATAGQLFDNGFQDLETIWAVDIESGEINSLYSARAGREPIFGWISTDTFIVGAYNFESPLWGLSRVKISQPGLQPIMDGYLDGVDLEMDSGTILVEINRSYWEPTIPKGIYRLDSRNGRMEMLISGENLYLWGWMSEISAYAIYNANMDQVKFLNINGETILTLPMPGNSHSSFTAPSPDGHFIVVGETSIYTLSGELIKEWTGSRFLSWLPDSSGVVAENCSQGFFEVRLSINDWQPVKVTTLGREYCYYRIVP